MARKQRLPGNASDYEDIPEKAWQGTVEEIFGAHQWMVFHVSDSRKRLSTGQMVGDIGISGWPDVVAVKLGWMVVLELKRQKGKLTGRQPEVIRMIMSVGGNVICGVARPADVDLVISLAANPHLFDPNELSNK